MVGEHKHTMEVEADALDGMVANVVDVDRVERETRIRRGCNQEMDVERVMRIKGPIRRI